MFFFWSAASKFFASFIFVVVIFEMKIKNYFECFYASKKCNLVKLEAKLQLLLVRIILFWFCEMAKRLEDFKMDIGNAFQLLFNS